MFYNILASFSSEWTVLNVFRYISFRSLAALITALLLSIFLGPKFIAWLHKIKCGQYIHEDVSAHAAKAGTPTMGGILMISVLSISLLLWADLKNSYIWQTYLVFIGFGLVGLLDDLAKLRHHKNIGLSARAKMGGQLCVACIAMCFLMSDPLYNTKLVFPFFKDWMPDLGLWYLPFGVLVMISASNAVNLTDGLDGLAIGPAIVACLIFSFFIYITGNAKFSQYLYVHYMAGVGEVTIFCAALVGTGLGFLWFNAYPAQVFMGDVGSLSIGGVLGYLALLCKQELVLPIIGGVFVVETMSVILQVGYFRWTKGKRLFRMAPIHHHFELKGIPESKIIIRFWITSILLGLLALTALKLR